MSEEQETRAIDSKIDSKDHSGLGVSFWVLDGERYVKDRSASVVNEGEVFYWPEAAPGYQVQRATFDRMVSFNTEHWILRPAKTFEGGPSGTLIETGEEKEKLPGGVYYAWPLAKSGELLALCAPPDGADLLRPVPILEPVETGEGR